MSKRKSIIPKTTNSRRLSNKFEEVQLIYRNKTKAKDRPNITSPDAAYKILLDSWDKDQISLLEEAKILLLDNSLKLMSIASVSKGGLTGTVVDPRIVFAIALKRRASCFILCHNHPTGNLKPSESDLSLTKKFVEAGKLLNINVQDHLIITQNNYLSLANEGLIDPP